MKDDLQAGTAADHSEPVAFQQYDIPESTTSRRVLGDYDYADKFVLPTAAAELGSPEQWAWAAFDDVAGAQGRFLWRWVLGLRLARRSAPGHIAGWKIADRGDGWVTVAARSWMLTGNLLVEVEKDSVSVSTFVRFERAIGSRVWAALAGMHRRVAPGLLPDARQILLTRR
ncbi:MAG: hypothetical protein ACRD0P_39345 [Stackebrandtia sp.]